jgi:hypothetical protein
MLCPSCNKFASYDTGNEPEVEVEVSDDGEVSGSVTIALHSQCCGDELKGASFDVNESISLDDVEDELKDQAKEAGIELPKELAWSDVTVDSEFDVSSVEITERRETTKTDKKGKIIYIKARYQKTFYGFQLNGNVVVNYTKDDKVLTVRVPLELADDMQASSLDELT